MVNLAGESDLHIYPLSESAVTVTFGSVIDESIVNRVNAFDRLLKQKGMPGMYQTVPAYASLTVYFDPLVLAADASPGATCFDKARSYLLALNDDGVKALKTESSTVITIPVCYEGAFGSDLEYIATHTKLSTNEVIKLHSEVIYKVCMIGFIPGFAYLGGLNPLLEVPRKARPVKVTRGSVGIAGVQTGIYPLETPGGWQIIGRTPLSLFDAKRAQPSLLKAGGHVKFEPVSLPDFEKYNGE